MFLLLYRMSGASSNMQTRIKFYRCIHLWHTYVFLGTDVTPRAGPPSSPSRASPYARPPPVKKRALPETDETKMLSTTELHRLVLLEQLKLTRLQMEKEAVLMNFLNIKMNNVNNLQQEENENSFNVYTVL